MIKRVILWGCVIVLLVFTGGAIYLARWWMYDQVRLFGFTPSNQLVTISEDSGFSEYGQRLFYVHKPKVLEAAEFNQACEDRKHNDTGSALIDGETGDVDSTIVLGCYDGVNIYIFDVRDERLDGVEEVTAAHEMLHAAYTRLDSSEKAEVNEWLLVAESRVTNPRIRSVIESYRKLPEESRLNELHSIIGTEESDIPEFLENYYKKYFVDRTNILKISNAYEKVFTDIRAEISSYDEALASLSLRISLLDTELQASLDDINRRRDDLPPLLDQERFDEYNALVRRLQSDIAQYNSRVGKAQELISEYNTIVVQRNALGEEQNNLVQSISSKYEQVEGQ